MNVFGCHLNAQIKLVASDSGQVLAAFTDTATERDFTVEQALFHAARKLGGQLAAKIAERAGPARERRVEIHVATSEPSDVKVIERVLEWIQSLSGVRTARLLDAGERELRLEIRASGRDVKDLASELADQSNNGLFVWGWSEHMIRARLRLGRALSLLLVPTEFGARGKADASGAAQLLPRALAASLTSQGAFELDTGADLPRITSASARARLLARLSKRQGEAVLLVGTHQTLAGVVLRSPHRSSAPEAGRRRTRSRRLCCNGAHGLHEGPRRAPREARHGRAAIGGGR
ncbi:MAG: hypothetical protein HC923_07535 [Myxococcales bacterium]|nr:hypothetical protein [Myxococcales bacterium]